MLKQIYIENILNFKEGIIVDFTVNDENKVLSRKYNVDKISNISIIYGKNNVGKSNLLKIINDIKQFIIHGENHLKPFTPVDNSNTSTVEIIFENKEHEVRYGFEINLSENKVVDEWMFCLKGKAVEETEVFNRQNQYFHRKIKSIERKIMQEIQPCCLYINDFHNILNVNEAVDDTLSLIESIELISYNKLELNQTVTLFKQRLHYLFKHKNLYNILDKFILSSDLDIIEIIHDEENTNNNLLFKHKSNATFTYDELSSGTKQLLNMIVTLLYFHDKSAVLLFDEIENGLHVSLVSLFFKFIERYIKINRDLQIILTTHREELLDYDFISNDSKIFLQEKEYGNIHAKYLSEYIMSETHIPSKRYRLDAFRVNPNTSQEYDLHEVLSTIGEDDYE